MITRKERARRALKHMEKALDGVDGARRLNLVAWLEGELRALGLFGVRDQTEAEREVGIEQAQSVTVAGESQERAETMTVGSAAGVIAGSEQEWVWRKGEKIPIERVAVEAPKEEPVPVSAGQAVDEAAPAEVNGWPRECVLSIEGYPLNPKLLIGRLYGEEGGQTFRRVSVWRVRGRNLRPGMRVPCRLDRLGANPVYLPV